MSGSQYHPSLAVAAMERITCSFCGARPGQRCTTKSRAYAPAPHDARREEATRRGYLPARPAPAPGPPVLPQGAVQRAAEVMLRQYDSQYSAGHLTWRDFADDARAILEAALMAPGTPPAGEGDQ